MTKEQKKAQEESRKEWLDRLSRLIKHTKLDHNHEDFMHVSDLIELVYDIPDYDISDEDRNKWLKKLGVKI